VPKVPHPTLSGAVGSLKSPKVVGGIRAKLFRTFSTPLARRAATERSGANLPLPYHGQAPRLARAKRGAEKYPGVKKGR
jgi:hypothetical protein